MKTVFDKIYVSLLATALFLPACSPDTFEMEKTGVTVDDLVEGLAYTITPDASNPNIIYLESKMGSEYTPLWEHPQGRSQEAKVTLKMAFNGSYNVKFGVETRGGVVYGEPATFEIAAFCADFVTGEMWEMLAGGAGNSKTWIPDNGSYGMKQGFYSCFDPTATYADMTADEGKNNWFAKDKTWWEPTDGDVGITEDDLKSYMTFSLDGKAGLTTHRFTNGQETVKEGLFSMNTDNHTLSAVDVDFIHGAWADGKAVDFRTGFQILVLTENQMMIANYRDEALSGEGRCIYCWNFVSKDYADSYVPSVEEPTPVLPDGWQDDVSQIVTSTINWKLSADTPYDWCNLDGTRKNDFKSIADYPATAKPIAGISDLMLTMRGATKEYGLSLPGGDAVDGTYTVSEDGFYTFNNGLSSALIGGDWIYFGADADNALRLLSYEKAGNAVSEMWLGLPQKDSQGKVYQYLGYHFVAQSDAPVEVGYTANLNYFNTGWSFINSSDVTITREGSYTLTLDGSDNSPYGLYMDVMGILADHPNADITLNSIKVDGGEIDFDDELIDRGAGDDNTTARRYILNPWADPVIFDNPGIFAFDSSITVKFTVTFNDDASGEE